MPGSRRRPASSSQPSSTSSVLPRGAIVATRAATGSGSAAAPRPRATSAATSSWFVLEPSCTQSVSPSRTPDAKASASRDLPMPPRPVSVTSRDSAVAVAMRRQLAPRGRRTTTSSVGESADSRRCGGSKRREVDGDGLAARVDSELIGEHGAAVLVGLHRADPIAGAIERRDEGAVRALVGRVVLDQLSGGANGATIVARQPGRVDQRLARGLGEARAGDGVPSSTHSRSSDGRNWSTPRSAAGRSSGSAASGRLSVNCVESRLERGGGVANIHLDARSRASSRTALSSPAAVSSSPSPATAVRMLRIRPRSAGFQLGGRSSPQIIEASRSLGIGPSASASATIGQPHPASPERMAGNLAGVVGDGDGAQTRLLAHSRV